MLPDQDFIIIVVIAHFILQDMYEYYADMNAIRKDLERVRIMLELVKKRERAKKDFVDVMFAIFEEQEAPQTRALRLQLSAIERLVVQIQKKSKKAVANNLLHCIERTDMEFSRIQCWPMRCPLTMRLSLIRWTFLGSKSSWTTETMMMTRRNFG
jgi:hypothetical protein